MIHDNINILPNTHKTISKKIEHVVTIIIVTTAKIFALKTIPIKLFSELGWPKIEVENKRVG